MKQKKTEKEEREASIKEYFFIEQLLSKKKSSDQGNKHFKSIFNSYLFVWKKNVLVILKLM